MHAPDTAGLESYLQYLWDHGATDLHLAAGTQARVRIDGRLVPVPQSPELTSEFMHQVFAALITEAETDEMTRERQLDFAFTWADRARFRANAFYQLDRPALALRLIPAHVPTPEDIGLPASTSQLLNRPHGLVLMTGPTGSGKSTTLAAMVGWINRNRPLHILTIEDPIEYIHAPVEALVNQREVGRDAVSFPDALHAALREDPDVVLVGEMRDLETIALTLTLAETGHLVFATLHTTGSARTMDRIIDQFPPDQQEQVRVQLSVSILAVISQVMMPRSDKPGVIVAFEVMIMNPAIENHIRKAETFKIPSTIQTSKNLGMFLLDDNLLELYKGGKISRETLLAKAQSPRMLEQKLQGMN